MPGTVLGAGDPAVNKTKSLLSGDVGTVIISIHLRTETYSG